MQRIVHDEPRSIREQNPDIPEWLERFVLRLLEKDKARRFSSADEVALLLQQELAYLQNPALADRPDRRWHRTSAAPSSLRRWSAAASLLLALIAAMAGLMCYPFWLGDTNRADADRRQTVGSTTEEAGPSEQAASFSEPRRAAALLWAADGTKEARDFADDVEARWRQSTRSILPDEWNEQATELRRRLQVLSDSEAQPLAP